MRKKVRFVLPSILLVLIIGCIFKFGKSDENGNIANMGLACESKGVIYYNKYEKGIFSVKNGEEKQLTDETAFSLNLVGDKIYYITVADFNNVVIKCVDTNGQNMKKIATIYTSISKIYVDKQAIYYATNETQKGIAKIDLNGENETTLLTENVQDFQLSGNKIYYINSANQICRADISGENPTQLSDTAVTRRLQVIENWIYYYDRNEDALFRLKKNGKKKELVSVLIHNEIYNISGKYVYYFDRENSKIARMRIQKSNQCNDIAFLEVSKTKINVVGDEIYYLDQSKDEAQTYQMYRVKADGKESKKIEY